MAIVINGSGTVTGLAVGGLPDGTVDAGTLATDSVTAAKIAADSVDSVELIDGAVDDSHIAALAASKLTGALPAISGASLTGITNGITEYDMWRLSTSFTSDVNPISSNLERVDTYGFQVIGTGMSVSSGIWTFPSTGKWRIEANWGVEFATSVPDGKLAMELTTDNSSYNQVTKIYASDRDGSSVKKSAQGHYLFDVTNTTNCKVKFRTENTSASVTTMGATGVNWTYFTFIKIGET